MRGPRDVLGFAQARFKVAEGDSAREALLQSCNKWMKDYGVRKSLTPKLATLINQSPGIRHTTAYLTRSPVFCDAHARAARAAGSVLASLNFDVDVLATVKLFGSS